MYLKYLLIPVSLQNLRVITSKNTYRTKCLPGGRGRSNKASGRGLSSPRGGEGAQVRDHGGQRSHNAVKCCDGKRRRDSEARTKGPQSLSNVSGTLGRPGEVLGDFVLFSKAENRESYSKEALS